MRLTAGRLRGRRLECPPRGRNDQATRPTTGLVREALFNILSGRLPGTAFLDLFAGTGAVGLEAAGRGADPVVLVENNRRALSCLEKNLAACRAALARDGGGEPGLSVLAIDAFRAPAFLVSREERFGIIFADPPYGTAPQALARLVGGIAETGLLLPDGLLVVQYHRDLARGRNSRNPFSGSGLELLDARAYGSDRLAFLGRE